MNASYEDIMVLDHHISTTYSPMPIIDRAAQFAPFAALAGYDGAIRETGRLTEDRIEISEELQHDLNYKQRILCDKIQERPTVTVTCFCPDAKKSGGEYVTIQGALKKVDPVKRCLYFSDGTAVLLDEIIELNSDLFQIQEYNAENNGF